MADPAAADDSGLSGALATLRSLLTSGETLEAWAAQRRVFALAHRRVLVAATSGRFIVLRRRLIGGFDSDNIRWQDLKDARVGAGILAADLTVIAQSSSDLNIGAQVDRTWQFEGLRKDQAQAMYRICQAHDQIWREKRRVRELEELRAKSGGVQLGAQGFAAPAGADNEPARRLRQAHEMLEAKLITDAEFESIKAKIVAGL